MSSDARTTAERLYTKMPDGSALDFNRVYDAIDRAQGKRKTDPLRSAKRFLYQYRDALRSVKAVQDRYDRVVAPVLCCEQWVLRDPTSRLSTEESFAAEAPVVSDLLSQVKEECAVAKNCVAWAISLLENDVQKTVITAHYVCEADLKWISAVYARRTYWANGIRDDALKVIVGRLNDMIPDSKEAVADLDRLITKWKEVEAGYKAYLAQQPLHEPLDDNRMLMGLM